MLGYYYLITFIVAGLLIGGYFIFRKKLTEHSTLFLKIISLTLVSAFFVRYMIGNEAIIGIKKLETTLFDNNFYTIMATLSVWFMYANIWVLTLYPFFKIKYRDFFAKYFSGFIVLTNIICLGLTVVAVDGKIALTQMSLRTVLMSIELAISIFYVFYVWFNNHSFKWTKKDVGVFLLSIFGMLLATMPTYVPQLFIGQLNPEIEIKGLGQWHRIYLYFAFIIPLTIYFCLRKKDYYTKRYALLYLSLGALFTFMSGARFSSWLNPTTLPIHLCHTAMYIVPICLIFKLDKVFYFTFFINVLGAFLAMAMPDTSGNMISYSMIRFWNNHYIAFFMPLLCVALKMYKRPKLKEFIYSAMAFTVYFVLTLFINAWFSNYGKVDFFFTNSDFIAEKLGKWAEDLRNITWVFYVGKLRFVLYPVYQFLFWLVYIIISAGMWFVYELSYKYCDIMVDMGKRRKQYKLDELALETKLEGRSKEEPLYMENKNKMILCDFTKIYGKSNVYAVKDANLEINGGEIFGFLGPNGAGKSTIIKSIVGIQPITAGRIEVCGYDVDRQSVMAKKQIGFVPDHYALYEKLTGREYINYIADLYEVSQEDRDKRIEHYVDIFELKGAFDNQMKTYSHGMKQKIAIMSALVHNPKVWILDEPLTGLDPNSIFQVKECMKEHAKNGNIVFFSSHIIDVVEKICDRIGIIKKGQIQDVKSLKEIEDSGVSLEDYYMNIIENNKVEAIPVKNEKQDDQLTEKKTKLKKQKKEKTKKDNKKTSPQKEDIDNKQLKGEDNAD